jgi:hypothetical protein
MKLPVFDVVSKLLIFWSDRDVLHAADSGVLVIDVLEHWIPAVDAEAVWVVNEDTDG